MGRKGARRDSRNRAVRRAILSRRAVDNLTWALLAALDIDLMTWIFGIRIGVVMAFAFILFVRGLIAILERRGIHLSGSSVFTLIATAVGTWHMPSDGTKPTKRWERIKRRFRSRQADDY